MQLTARLPWWMGVLLAAGAYVVLREFASIDAPRASNVSEMGSVLGHSTLTGLATVFQYLLPPIFLIGAVLSVLGRIKRQNLYGRVVLEPYIDSLRRLNWREFEMLVGEAFRRRGYLVVETGSGADGGIDIVLSLQGGKYLVQCKHWKRSKVPVRVVRELNGVMAAQGAKGGFVVTSGVYTREAKEFAKAQNIELIEGEELVSMIGVANTQAAGGAKSEIQTREEPVIGSPDKLQIDTPNCPQCKSLMSKRRARKGANAGQVFWGCSQFPKCRGTRPAL